MTNLNLTESAWRRAVAESARIYPSIGFGVAATLTTIIFGAVAAVAAAAESTTNQIAYPIIGGALALALTFAVLFAVQLAVAPTLQRNELRAAWAMPEIETVNVDLMLRNAHRRGNELAQSLEGTNGTTTSQRNEIDQWVEEVVQLLAAHRPPEDGRAFIEGGAEERGPVRRLRSRVDLLGQLLNAQISA